jgi:hypothetical protein
MLDYLQYAAVTFGSFAISVDCVLWALFYCQAAISSPVLLFLIAFSTFVLNFLLYQWDAFKQFKKFFEGSGEKVTKVREIICNVVAFFAGASMTLFTYSVYINFSITFPFWAIITFSVAIGLGTMLLMRNSLERFIKELDGMVKKIRKNSIVFAVLLVVFVAATLAISVTWWSEIAALFIFWGASSFVAQILTGVFCIFLVGAEFVFCADKAADVSDLMSLVFIEGSVNEDKKWLRAVALGLGFVFMILNGINNGIMSANQFVNKALNFIAMVSGIMLSSSTMLVSVNNDVVEFFVRNDEPEENNSNEDQEKDCYANINFTHRLFAWFVCSAVIVSCLADMSIIAATAPLLGFIAGLDLLVPILFAKMFLKESELGFASENNVVVLLVALSLCCGLLNFTALTFRACYVASSAVALFGIVHTRPDCNDSSLDDGSLSLKKTVN